MLELELLRMVTDRVKDPDVGINAILPTTPLDLPGDYLPERIEFIASEVDQTDDGKIVQARREPPRVPALYITYARVPTRWQGEVPTDDHREHLPGQGPVVEFSLLDRFPEGPEAEHARAYIMRALVRCLKGLLDDAGTNGGVIRNGVELVGCETFGHYPLNEMVGAAFRSAGLDMPCIVRDTAPNP